jgi:hypothetical protein
MSCICKGISITERYEKGFLGGPVKKEFDFNAKPESFYICIEQIGFRSITITALQPLDLAVMWDLFSKIDMLFMILEGNFVPIYEGAILEDGHKKDNSELRGLIDNRVEFYNSADWTIGTHSFFISFQDVLTADLLTTWIDVLSELDILHPMVLYSMANTGLPIDCRCMFLIEAFEALAELTATKITTYALPSVGHRESKLGKYLSTLMSHFGKDVFPQEIGVCQDGLISIFVASRNRIAHIKSKQGKRVLSGPESVLYAVKLSYLYRIIILSLLGIDYDDYSGKVKSSVSEWDSWQGVLDGILQDIANQ